MEPATIQRYQPGGDIYAQVANSYGTPAADRLAAAARTGIRLRVTETLADIRSGPPRTGTSTLGNLWAQLTTDPLAAPLDGLNNALANSVKSFFRNPYVIALVVLIVFLAAGGPRWLLRKA
jgi:hypothetical protein